MSSATPMVTGPTQVISLQALPESAASEKADKVVKQSTGWCTKAAIRATHRQQIHECWKTSWNNEFKGKDLPILVPQPSRKNLMTSLQAEKATKLFICTDENRKNWALLISILRKWVEDIRCKYGHTSHSVQYVLMECRKFDRLKQENTEGGATQGTVWSSWVEEDVKTSTVHKESYWFSCAEPTC